MRKIILECQIWGDFYCETFIKYCISYIKDMLPEINKYPIEFHIYADYDSHLKLLPQIDLHFRSPEAGFPIHCHKLEDISNDPWLYTREADCKFHCMNKAVKEDAAVIFIDPNQIVCKGSWAYMLKQIEEGYDAVITKALRVAHDAPVSVPVMSRDAVKLYLEHLHPVHRQWIWGNIGDQDRMCYPCATFYPVGNEGFITCALHMAIPMVYPKTHGKREGFSPDHCYNTGWGLDKIKVVTDSDDAFFFEICPPDFGKHTNNFIRTTSSLRWAEVVSNPVHWTMQNLLNARHPIYHHTGELEEIKKGDEAFKKEVLSILDYEILKKKTGI